MNNAQYGSIRLQSSGSRVTTFFALGVAATVIIVLMFGTSLFSAGGMHMHTIVPAVSAAAFLNGLKTARKVYKTTKNIRHAMKVFGSWTVVSALISFGGDWLLGQVLNGNLQSLANW